MTLVAACLMVAGAAHNPNERDTAPFKLPQSGLSPPAEKGKERASPASLSLSGHLTGVKMVSPEGYK